MRMFCCFGRFLIKDPDQFFTLIRVFEDKMHTPLEDSIVEGFNRNEGLDDDRANVQ